MQDSSLRFRSSRQREQRGGFLLALLDHALVAHFAELVLL